MEYQKIIHSLTLEEKLRLLTGTGMNTSYPVDRLGIREMRFHDSPFGVRRQAADNGSLSETAAEIRSHFPNCQASPEVVSTAFPTGSAMGATFDPDTVEAVGQALGEEFRAYGINAIMGPAVNIKRHPLCGRNFEYLSEDPVLSGKLGAAYVRGVQEAGVAACPKHFAANNQERWRFTESSEVDERTLRELYLKPFEILVQEAHPWSIMSAYNRLNGVYAAEHRKLLQTILRDEWGFDGIIVSDWWSVKNRAYSLRASLELCMPYQEEALGQLEAAYSSGIITDAMIDGAVERLLRFQRRTQAVYTPCGIDFDRHQEIALEAARKSMTLLKNEHDALPLRRDRDRHILVIGDRAALPFFGGDGSSRVKNPPKVDSPLDVLRELLEPEVRIDYLPENRIETYANEIGYMEGDLTAAARDADTVIFFAGQSFSENSEAVDRNHIQLEPYYEHAFGVCKRLGKRVIVVLNIGSVVSTRRWQRSADAILVSWLGGQAMGRAVAETLCGQNNPAGRLAETFPQSLSDVKSLENYPGNGYAVTYREGLDVGYRHFDRANITPEYEFGFGLSYSRFTYSDLTRDGLTLRFFVTNESSRDGDEVVQVYLSFPEDSCVSHPPKALKAFRRISVPAGARVPVEIALTEADFQYYNTALDRWVREDGVYTIWVGASSRNLPLCCPVPMTPGLPLTTQVFPD